MDELTQPHITLDEQIYPAYKIEVFNQVLKGQGIDPKAFLFSEIHATYDTPGHASAYNDIFQCPIRFGQPRNELRLEQRWLEQALVRSNPITAELTREVCDQILTAMTAHGGAAHDVYEILANDLRRIANIENVAAQLNLTSRTLRRRLNAQGTSFQQLLSQVRKQFAIAYLRETRMKVDEVAERLGFSDAANFLRPLSVGPARRQALTATAVEYLGPRPKLGIISTS